MTEEFWVDKRRKSLDTKPELEDALEEAPREVVVVGSEDLAAMWDKTFPEGEQDRLMSLISRLNEQGKITESDWVLRMSNLADAVLTSQGMAKSEAGMNSEEKVTWIQEEIQTAEREFLDGNVFAVMEGAPVYVGAEVNFRAKSGAGVINDRLLRVGNSEGTVARVDLTEVLTLNE